MAYECEYCGRHASLTGELRMASDPHKGGASYPCCHDCYCDGHSCETCEWHNLKTVDEWHDQMQSARACGIDMMIDAATGRYDERRVA